MQKTTFINSAKINLGKKLSQNTKDKLSIAKSKPILQFNTNGILIKEWSSALIASKQLNIGRTSISNCCNGVTKYFKGFIWKFKNNN